MVNINLGKISAVLAIAGIACFGLMLVLPIALNETTVLPEGTETLNLGGDTDKLNCTTINFTLTEDHIFKVKVIGSSYDPDNDCHVMIKFVTLDDYNVTDPTRAPDAGMTGLTYRYKEIEYPKALGSSAEASAHGDVNEGTIWVFEFWGQVGAGGYSFTGDFMAIMWVEIGGVGDSTDYTFTLSASMEGGGEIYGTVMMWLGVILLVVAVVLALLKKSGRGGN